MTLSTIQPIGKKPVTRPNTEARSASGAGMVKAHMAMQIAAMSAITAARCALTLPDAMSTNNTTPGTAATSVDNHSLPRGSYTWFHMALFLPRGALLHGKITGLRWTVTLAPAYSAGVAVQCQFSSRSFPLTGSWSAWRGAM